MKKELLLISSILAITLSPLSHATGGEKIKGFRELASPEESILARLDSMKEADQKGILRIENPFSAWADVMIDDMVVGVLDPYTTGEIEVDAPSEWTVQFRLPNGYTTERTFCVR